MASSSRKKRPGRPIDRTDDELERLALTTPADVEDARAWWREDAPERYKDLLEAGNEED